MRQGRIGTEISRERERGRQRNRPTERDLLPYVSEKARCRHTV